MLNGHPSSHSHSLPSSQLTHQEGPPSNMGPLPYLPSTYGYATTTDDAVNTGGIPPNADHLFTGYEDMFGGNIGAPNVDPTYEGRDGDEYYMDLLRMGGGGIGGGVDPPDTAASGGSGSGASLGQNVPSATRLGEFAQLQRREKEDGSGPSGELGTKRKRSGTQAEEMIGISFHCVSIPVASMFFSSSPHAQLNPYTHINRSNPSPPFNSHSPTHYASFNRTPLISQSAGHSPYRDDEDERSSLPPRGRSAQGFREGSGRMTPLGRMAVGGGGGAGSSPYYSGVGSEGGSVTMSPNRGGIGGGGTFREEVIEDVIDMNGGDVGEFYDPPYAPGPMGEEVIDDEGDEDLIHDIQVKDDEGYEEQEGGEEEPDEEPLYVNAKQYHRILKRRAARARLEEMNQLIRQRKVSV